MRFDHASVWLVLCSVVLQAIVFNYRIQTLCGSKLEQIEAATESYKLTSFIENSAPVAPLSNREVPRLTSTVSPGTVRLF